MPAGGFSAFPVVAVGKGRKCFRWHILAEATHIFERESVILTSYHVAFGRWPSAEQCFAHFAVLTPRPVVSILNYRNVTK